MNENTTMSEQVEVVTQISYDQGISWEEVSKCHYDTLVAAEQAAEYNRFHCPEWIQDAYIKI